MSKTILAERYEVGTPTANYRIERVTADPRLAPGLAAPLGSMVEYVTALGSVTLQKYAAWDRAWRVPGAGPLYPNTSDLFLGATKVTPTSLYLNDQMLTTIFDASGNGNNLTTVTGTPTFQRTLEDKIGIFYDGVGDGHDANVNDPAAGSFLFGAEAAIINVPAFNAGIVQRITAGALGYAIVFISGTPDVYLVVDDGATNITQPFGVGAAVTANPRVPFFMSGQVDRAAGRLRGRISRGGAMIATIDVALAGLGDLSKPAQVFGFGAPSVGGVVGGGWIGYAYYATGAQTEGANALRDLHVGLGAEL